MAQLQLVLLVLIVQIHNGNGQWNGLTHYVTATSSKLDMLFVFDTANDDMFDQAAVFAAEMLASADIDGDLVHVGLMTFNGVMFYKHYWLNNGLTKTALQNSIMNLDKVSASPVTSFDEFNEMFSETNGGREYVHNVTVFFVSNYSTSANTSFLQALQTIVFDSEINVVGFQVYDATNLMSFADHVYVFEDLSQLGSFTATIFFHTFTDDCYRDGSATATTTAATTPYLATWTLNAKENLILDTSLLSSTIRKKTSAPDSRTSSAVIGYSGFIFVLFIVITPIVVDIPTFITHVKLSIRYQQKYRQKKLLLKAT
ncbi:uncharacterized protein [Argopecten irradians]|uniref:uncharacterized protein n=1 Tax=Argopecten irradians TaxID=31199 RepID=UPI00372341D9